MEKLNLKTEYRQRKEAKDLAIYKDWNALMKKEGAMSGAVTDVLMRKYNIFSRSAIYVACRRAEKRLNK